MCAVLLKEGENIDKSKRGDSEKIKCDRVKKQLVRLRGKKQIDVFGSFFKSFLSFDKSMDSF